ncbi:MAG: CBS domain-containing protein [Candidatus Aenigmarchaeota archaeon]|nr:CBS domain-containing protein [Candidatus Aenigmarchaeota archaeon]
MNVRELMTKNIVSARPDEHISQALGKMEKHRLHQLLVMTDSRLYGMLELKKIVSKNMDISSAKVENFATNVPNIDANASVESATQLLLSSALRAVPVTDGGDVVGIISESDIMKVAKQFVKPLNEPVDRIASEAEHITKDGNYGQIKRLIFDRNVSRVPIVDDGKVVGIVSTLEMIRMLRGKETMEVRGGTQEKAAREKIRMEETPATAMMRNAIIVPGSKAITDVIDLLRTNEEVIISGEGIKIVTHRDILELFPQAKQNGVHVQITGMQDESIDFKAKMDTTVTDFVKKISRMVNRMEYLVVHIEKMHKQSPKEKYSIRARFKSPEGFFVAHAWGWKPIDVIQEVFGNLEREVLNKHGKIRSDVKKSRAMRKAR